MLNASWMTGVQRLLKAGQDFYLYGLRGSSLAWLLPNLQHTVSQPLIVVAASFERAEQLYDDLHFFQGSAGLYFFPHWDTLPYDNFSPNRDLVARRFLTLQALSAGQAQLVVTTPHALMQRLMPREIFLQQRISIQAEQELPREALLPRLQQAGYLRVDCVEERGEYSVHGEMLDLFPMNTTGPIRLEWEGSKLVHLKSFDVQTQLTTPEVWKALEILPAQEVLRTPEAQQSALTQLLRFQDQVSQELYAQTYALLKQELPFPGIESLLGLFYPRPGHFFDYCPATSLIVHEDPEAIQEKAQGLYDEIFGEYELSREQGNLALSPEQLYLSPSDLNHTCRKFLQISCVGEHETQTAIYASQRFPFLDNHKLRTEISEQGRTPHTSIVHILHRLKNWQQEKKLIVLTAKTQTQADHFQQLLHDFNLSTQVVKLQAGQSALQWLEAYQRQLSAQSALPILVGELSMGFREVDEAGQTCWALLTEQEIFGEKARNRRMSQHAKVQAFAGSLEDLQEGDYVVHLDYGIGKYMGLQKLGVQGRQTEFMTLVYAKGGKVYVPVEKFHLVQKYVNADGGAPALHSLGDKAWKKTKAKVSQAVEEIAGELVEIYAARKAAQGFAFPPDDGIMQEFELSFPYEETPDQLRAIEEVKSDMEATMPMDRLVCGDVGFGKTEVAMRAAFKAANSGKQVCMLVPTTILAQQHYSSFKKRFQNLPLRVEVISRFRSASEQTQVLKSLKRGEVDVLIGTHRLLSADVQFKDLGLLIVDEEQRFGVKHKEKIKRFRANVDVLTLSATPIPRTLHMSLVGIRDLSIITTPPPDRLAIRTRFLKSSDHILQEAVSREVRRGGQVFVVHNRVETIFEYASYLQSVLPKVKLGVAHGQMSEHELERVMLDFTAGEFDVLVATTIIESGLDIPRANTIIINNAHHFGLSQLYQLRGRVGRSNIQAYAYLLIPPDKVLANIAEERLRVLQEFNDLGVGFKIASRDLELRGAGNLLGAEQSGHIASVGLELYTQMIERAVHQKQNQETSFEPLSEIKIDLGFDLSIPEDYIANTSQRLSLYKQLASIHNDDELWALRSTIEDRFGHLPESVINLFQGVQLRLLAVRYGLKALEYSRQQLRLQLGQVEKLQTERLVQWMQEPRSRLRFIPESTLVLDSVPHSLTQVLEAMRQMGQLFTVA